MSTVLENPEVETAIEAPAADTTRSLSFSALAKSVEAEYRQVVLTFACGEGPAIPYGQLAAVLALIGRSLSTLQRDVDRIRERVVAATTLKFDHPSEISAREIRKQMSLLEADASERAQKVKDLGFQIQQGCSAASLHPEKYPKLEAEFKRLLAEAKQGKEAARELLLATARHDVSNELAMDPKNFALVT